MRIIYKNNKKFRLNRTPKQRWHLIRILSTQLIEHERIKTTYTKAKHLQPTMEHLIRKARQAVYFNRENIKYSKIYPRLDTDQAREKLFNVIVPRFEVDNGDTFTKIVKLNKRKGDNAQMAYIEIRGNEIAKYEQEQE